MSNLWMDYAACNKPHIDPNWFFAEHTSHNYTRALMVCDTCPVTNECLQYAVDNRMMEGIYGGKEPAQIRQIIRKVDK